VPYLVSLNNKFRAILPFLVAPNPAPKSGQHALRIRIRLYGYSQRLSRPAALASFPWRSSKVQNRFAFSSRAQATCRLSSVRIPSLGPNRRPRSAHSSKAVSGTGMVCQIRTAQSSWKSRWSRSASAMVICRRNTCCAIACVHSAMCSGVIGGRSPPPNMRSAVVEWASFT